VKPAHAKIRRDGYQRKAKREGMAYVIVDGTLIPVDLVTCGWSR